MSHSAPTLRVTDTTSAQVDFYMQGSGSTVSAIQVAANKEAAKVQHACD